MFSLHRLTFSERGRLSAGRVQEYASQVPTLNLHTRVTFGLFEVDLAAGQLWKAGYRVKLQSQPFMLLTMLLERPGQVIPREELQLRLWGKDTTVDADHSLGIAINKIREALGDSADNPRFVETLARRGYRFIAPVAMVPEVHPDEPPTHEPPTQPDAPQLSEARAPLEPEPLTVPTERPPSAPVLAAPPGRAMQGRLWWGLALAALVLLSLAGMYLAGRSHAVSRPPHLVKVTQNGHFAPSITNMESLAASASDGVHLFSPIIENGHPALVSIALTGGMVSNLTMPAEVASPALSNISPDGSRLLVREHLSPESEQPLWIVPTIGGSAQRVGSVLAHDATWMPDGEQILYASGNELLLTGAIGNNPTLYASLPGRAFWLRWEPNGHLLRFTIIDPIAHTMSLWQLSSSDRKPVPLLAGFSDPPSQCCGVWTADGSNFIFQSSRGRSTDLWRLSGESTRGPEQLTDGPLQFEAPVAARSGDQIFFLGLDARSELQRYVPGLGMVPERGFLSSAIRVDYTRDGKWVAWTNNAGQLWRARVDGTEQLQLTPDSYDVFLAHWSPDGSRLALMAREPGKAWTLHLVSANGTNLRPLLTESRNAADPSWSPDGQTLVFGRVNDFMGKESGDRMLSLLDLRTNQIQSVPGSDNLFSPRWSPDGKYIAALSLDQRSVRLFDVASRTWTTLPVRSGADPVWSSDSRSLYLHASLERGQPIDRIGIPDGQVQEIVRLADSPASDAVDYVFGGLTQDNAPLVRARIFTGNIYSLDLR